MKKYFLLLTITLLTLASCDKKQDPWAMSPSQIGLLNKEASWEQLDSIFAQDSLIKNTTGDDYLGKGIPEIEVFETGGKLLLRLKGSKEEDGQSGVKTVHVMDNRFMTAQGVGLGSTYGAIKKAYTINKIQNSINNAIIYVNEINAYFSIDKKHLPGQLRNNATDKIEATMIPDDAPIKNMYLDWRN